MQQLHKVCPSRNLCGKISSRDVHGLSWIGLSRMFAHMGNAAGRFEIDFDFAPDSNAHTNFEAYFQRKRVRVRIVQILYNAVSVDVIVRGNRKMQTLI